VEACAAVTLDSTVVCGTQDGNPACCANNDCTAQADIDACATYVDVHYMPEANAACCYDAAGCDTASGEFCAPDCCFDPNADTASCDTSTCFPTGFDFSVYDTVDEPLVQIEVRDTDPKMGRCVDVPDCPPQYTFDKVTRRCEYVEECPFMWYRDDRSNQCVFHSICPYYPADSTEL